LKAKERQLKALKKDDPPEVPPPEDWEEFRRLLEEINRKLSELYSYMVPPEEVEKAEMIAKAREIWGERYNKGLVERYDYHFRKRSYFIYHGKEGTEWECQWSRAFRF